MQTTEEGDGAMAFCGTCGARNDEAHAFCTGCGAALAIAEGHGTAAPSGPTQLPGSASAPREPGGYVTPVEPDRAAPVRRHVSRRLLVGSLVVAVAAALAWFFFFRAADPAQYRVEVLKQAQALVDGQAVLESGYYSLQNDDLETANANYPQTRAKMSEAIDAMNTACNTIRGMRAPAEYADVQAKLRVYADWWVESGASGTSSALGRIAPPFTAQEVADELATSGLESDEVAGYMQTFLDGCEQIDVTPR